MTDDSKTIIAIATPLVPSAIGIIRISGSNALNGISEYFGPFGKSVPQPNRMYHGVLEVGGFIDECMAVYYKAPKSYTGEDSVELYCHGSVALLCGIVKELIDRAGFVQAEGGDFTARAYKNGKLDLTEAEGVIDLINAGTQAEIRGAYNQLTGELKRRIEKIQQRIIELRADSEAAIDYPEEDVEKQSAEALNRGIGEIKRELDDLVGSYRSGHIINSGVCVTLVGKPNVGKSSLMNSLIGYERAIVTDEAGTTRDALTESYIYNGMRFVLTDTAGLREAKSLPERMGIERANIAAKAADVAVIVVEAGSYDGETERLKAMLGSNGRAVVIAENKTDINPPSVPDAVAVSALTGAGIETLKARIFEAVGVVDSNGGVLTNLRQYNAAVAAKTHIDRAAAIALTAPVELTNADLYDAYAELGKITGTAGSDALVAELFKRFCVGK